MGNLTQRTMEKEGLRVKAALMAHGAPLAAHLLP
jgi:hypothetical protein